MILKRQYLKQITPLIDKNIIKVITGMRRSGKSILLNQIIGEMKNRGVSEEHILFIDFEINDFDKAKLNETIINFIKNKDEKYYLFFDEIQNVDGWELSLSGAFATYSVDIYVTGSNANLLSGELATYLTGRYIQFHIYPFSFKEIYEFYKLENENVDKNQLFEEYVKYGGMPFSLNLNDENKINYLQDVYTSIIFRDVLKRIRINNIDLLDKLIKFIMANIGQTFSANSISKFFKNEKIEVNNKTIYNYLKCFENACFINRVFREDIVGKKILNFNEKFFLTDVGFRQAIYGNNLRDIGQILENIVYLELLRRGYEVTIGKLYQKEVDFIARKNGDKIYIQVAYIMGDENTRKREFESLLKIKDAYPKYVISTDMGEYNYEGVKKINMINFLLDDNMIL